MFKKLHLDFFIKHEVAIARFIQILLCIFVIIRISMAWQKEGFGDTRYFVETAKLIISGISPYHPETNPTKYKYPLQSPSMSLLSMPLCFTSETFQNLFFFFGGIVAFFLFTFLVFNYFGIYPRELVKAKWENIPIWITLFLIFCSSPFLLMLKHGQNSSFTALFLFIALFYPQMDKKGNIIFLALSAAMKYSLLTMQVPILVLQKRLRLCIFSLSLFIVMILAVGLWLDGIIPALMEYVNLLITNTQSGANSYSDVNSHSFVHIGFFSNRYLNIFFKSFLLLLYMLTCLRIYFRARTNLNDKNYYFPQKLTALEWGAFTTMTMAISYHRLYDCILFLPFLGVVFFKMIQKKEKSSIEYIYIILLFINLVFWATPQGMVFALESCVGEFFPKGKVLFLYSSYRVTGYTMMFPITKLVVLGTTILLFVMELSTKTNFPTEKAS